MGNYVINGGNKLVGEVYIQGSKNSVLAILFATLILDGESLLFGVPDISDVKDCIDILRFFGVEIEYLDKTTLKINTSNIGYRPAPTHLTAKLRASSYLLGSLTAKFGKCEFETSGGCNFGTRPLDMHFFALNELGARSENGCIIAKNGLKGTKISFKTKSVGATVNAIIAASKSKGVTVIENAAKEPHICDLASFLNCCGAEIIGAGTDRITVVGKDKLHGTRYTVDSDMIEAGTLLIAALMTGGRITCINAPIGELFSFFEVIKRTGANVIIKNDCLTVFAKGILPTNVITAPYPDFPTDLQPQITALLGLANGSSYVTETIFANRFAYVNELKKAGLNSIIKGDTLQISGIKRYNSAKMTATDLRGGAAMVLAALSADGQSVIENSELIERGYSDFILKLRSLGADIKRG